MKPMATRLLEEGIADPVLGAVEQEGVGDVVVVHPGLHVLQCGLGFGRQEVQAAAIRLPELAAALQDAGQNWKARPSPVMKWKPERVI